MSPSAETKAAIGAFEENALRRLERMRDALKSGEYRFSPARGVPVRREGKAPRPIVVQDVADRIVQRSLLDVVMSVDDVANAIKTDSSYGGIPGQGVDDAIKPVVELIRSGTAQYFIRSDIRDFFGTMPRPTALGKLMGLLPDRSLDDFLEDATQTELSNHRELGHLLDFFPNAYTGVPQGHALSALLGNLLLQDFDRSLNTGDARTIRYLDDFLILAPSKSAAHEAFNRGRVILEQHKLECYLPKKGGKAAEGSARKLFEFLGCEIAVGFVRPSKRNRKKLLQTVENRLKASAMSMTGGAFGASESYSSSLATTLSGLSRTLRGWSEQYSFCNYEQIRNEMDREIDQLLSAYIGTYADRRQRNEAAANRRMLGVWLLSDAPAESLW